MHSGRIKVLCCKPNVAAQLMITEKGHMKVAKGRLPIRTKPQKSEKNDKIEFCNIIENCFHFGYV